MDRKVDGRKRIVKIVAGVVAALVLAGAMHILFSSLDLFEWIRKLHGG